MKYNIAVVGATGLVGSTMLKVLEEKNIPINNLYLYASKNSKGKKVNFCGKEYEIIELNEQNIRDDIDIALFSAGASISKQYVPKFVEKGASVIDNSSQFRNDDNIPLVVPEVNANRIIKKGIIANPNCSTITVMPVLKFLSDNYGLKRVVYSTYQSVSGAGIKGLNDLDNNTTTKFDKQIFNNLIPYIDDFLDNNYTKEEMKMINETRKILELKDLKVTATCIRVPVRYSHAVSVNVELIDDFDLDKLKNDLKNANGVIVVDDKILDPLYTQDRDETFVSRIRRDYSVKSGLNLWVLADNIRKGASTNAVQILEYLINVKEV